MMFLRNQFIKSFNKKQLFQLHNLKISPEQVQQYKNEGYTVFPEVFDHEQIDQAIKYTKQMIKNSKAFEDSRITFTTGQVVRGEDFLKTGDKIHYFFEDNVDSSLKVDEKESLNKIGHAQHDLDPFFQQFCYQNIFSDILKAVGYENPTCVQTMYIFKNPKIGGEVKPHTDNTYLITTPLSTIGVWIAFHDANIKNGCLWGVPGSHKELTDYFMYRSDDNKSTYYNKEEPDYQIQGAVPIEAKKGTVVIFDGNFVHYSQHNHSKQPRHAFTLHFTEGHKNGHPWHNKNWMQREQPDLPFFDFYQKAQKQSQQQWKNYLE